MISGLPILAQRFCGIQTTISGRPSSPTSADSKRTPPLAFGSTGWPSLRAIWKPSSKPSGLDALRSLATGGLDSSTLGAGLLVLPLPLLPFLRVLLAFGASIGSVLAGVAVVLMCALLWAVMMLD